MALRKVRRRLAVGIAAAIALIAAQSVAAADDRGVVQGVVNDANGQPVAGAFVKLKNAERRLTFMVISQTQGRFEASDLPAGQYTVQGVGAGYESDWFTNVAVSAGGQAAKVGLSLTNKQGAMLTPAWPKRVPEAQIGGISKELPAGDNKELVTEKCTSCHDTQRIVVKRTDRNEWEHIISRMRGIMVTSSIPDLSDAQATAIADYVSANFKPLQSYDANSRLPRTLMTGKATQYRVVTYDLVNHYAEPHDVASDPTGNGWVAERAGKLGRFDPKTLEFTERNPPPGPAAPDRQRLGNPQIDSKGILWVADGPNSRWLSYDTANGKFLAFAWPRGRGGAGETAWPFIRTARSGAPA
jgi:hypothetical protein